MRKFSALLCAVLLLCVSACGNSEDDKAKANIKASVLKSNSSVTGGAKLTEQQAQCFADGMVDDVGVDKMKKYHLLDDKLQIVNQANPTDMTAADADATAGVITKCVDLKKVITDQISSGSKSKLTSAQVKCVSDAIDEDKIKQGLSASFQGKKNSAMQGMSGAIMSCMVAGGSHK